MLRVLAHDFTQKRLAVLVLNSELGTPQRGIPIYAEAVLTPAPSRVLRDRVHNDSTSSSDLPPSPALDRLGALPTIQAHLISAFGKLVDYAAMVTADGDDAAKERYEKLTATVVTDLKNEQVLAEPPPDTWREGFAASMQKWADKFSIPLKSSIAGIANEETDNITFSPSLTIPLGVLATDHVGFVSFDLSNVRAPPEPASKILAFDQAETIPTRSSSRNIIYDLSFYVYPGLLEKEKFKVLDQGRVSTDAILTKLEISTASLAPFQQLSLGVASLQNPDLVDWRISPGSFATVSQSMIGADGCEAFTPANFAVSTFELRQVVQIPSDPPVQNPKAFVNEYSISIVPIGHSLGSVLYTLPLAAGESVKVAVIDWRREDEAARTEKTGVTESLIHDQSRDRLISETVSSALEEWQRGGSIMAGAAVAAGGSYGTVKAGGTAAVGGAYTTSKGNRDLSADSVQSIADGVRQSSAAVRELYSSVVVQTDSTETGTVQTRTVFNNNRGHTMTVLYYEIVRHFRVVVSFKRRYQALLLSRPTYNFTSNEFLLQKQYVLAPALLDQSMKAFFDSVARAEGLRIENIRKQAAEPSQAAWEGDSAISSFTIVVNMGQTSDDQVGFQLIFRDPDGSGPLAAPPMINLRFGGGSDFNNRRDFDRGGQGQSTVRFDTDPFPDNNPGSLAWSQMLYVRFYKIDGSSDLAPNSIDILANFVDGTQQSLYDHKPGTSYRLTTVNSDIKMMLKPPTAKPVVAPIVAWDQAMTPEDYFAMTRLQSHLSNEAAYYNRVLDFNMHPDSWVTRLDSLGMLNMVSPTPLETLGNKIAFALLKQDDTGNKVWPAIPDEERLITLPTRGVFAEGRLGHCNIAEEIDDTRFWKWEEHPNPMVATDIQSPGLVPPTKSDLTGSLAPTQLPPAIVNIQQPLAAPDPVGLTAALKAISTPDIFRDMSAQTEVGALLKDLISGAVDMSGAKSRAEDIQAKQAASATSGGGGSGGGSSDPVIARAQAQDNRVAQQQLGPADAQHTMKVIDNAAADGTITRDQATAQKQTVLSNIKGGSVPKPVANAVMNVVRRTFQLNLVGQGGIPLIGMWAWELKQAIKGVGNPVESTLAFSLMDRQPDGKIIVNFTQGGDGGSDPTDPVFSLNVNGEVLQEPGINSHIVSNLVLDLSSSIPAVTSSADSTSAARFKAGAYQYVELQAKVATFTRTASDFKEVTKQFTETVGVALEGPDAFKKVLSVKPSWTGMWTDASKTTDGHAETFVISYYDGGFDIKSVK